MPQHPRKLSLILALFTLCALQSISSSASANELISLTCGAASADGAGYSVVPVTVKLSSGAADYVDLTYSAVDLNGNPCACTPPSARHYVSRTTGATDNVQVACAGATFPITFTASATGEAAGGDHETCETQIASTQCGHGGADEALAIDLYAGNKIDSYIVPVLLTSTAAAGSPIQLKYSYNPAISPVFPTPSRVQRNYVSQTLNVNDTVYIDGGVNGSNAVQITATVNSDPTPPTLPVELGHVAYTIPNAAAASNQFAPYTLTVGPAVKNSRYLVQVAVPLLPTGSHARLRYRAWDATTMEHVPCSPVKSVTHSTRQTDVVLVEMPANAHDVTFQAMGRDDGASFKNQINLQH